MTETEKTFTIFIERYGVLQDFKEEDVKLNQKVQWLLDGIKLSRKTLFGVSSERVLRPSSSVFRSTKRRFMGGELLRKQSLFPLPSMRKNAAVTA